MSTALAHRIDLSFLRSAPRVDVHRINLSFTSAVISQNAKRIDLRLTSYAQVNKGYIAGEAAGILTVNNVAKRRSIYVFEAENMNLIKMHYSLSNGHYLIDDLDPDKKYLIMGRDNEKAYEPFAYDWVKPATDKTIKEQQQMWESWQ